MRILIFCPLWLKVRTVRFASTGLFSGPTPTDEEPLRQPESSLATRQRSNTAPFSLRLSHEFSSRRHICRTGWFGRCDIPSHLQATSLDHLPLTLGFQGRTTSIEQPLFSTLIPTA